MKVLSKPVGFVPFNHTCRECESELEVDNETDIHYYYFSDQRDGTDEYFFIKCPVCGEQQRIVDKYVPVLLARSLRKAKRGY